MSKPNNSTALILALGVTTALMAASVWLIYRVISPASNSETIQVTETTPEQSNQLLLLGDTFSGYSTFRNPEFQATLAEADLVLKYQDEFDQARRAEMLNQGEADLIVTSLDQFLKYQPQGKIIGLIDRTVGADAVVLNNQKYPQLKSLLDLKALSQEQGVDNPLYVTYAANTPSEYLALVLSTQFESFNLQDFSLKEVEDASQAWDLLQNSAENIVLAVVWEPFVTRARQNGYTVVLSSKDVPTAIVDVIVASDRLISSNPELINQFLESYYRRIDINVREPSQLKQQIAEDGQISAQDATYILQGIDFFTSVEARDWMSDSTLDKRIQATAAVLVLSGKLDQVPPDPKLLYQSNFIAQAAENTDTLIAIVKEDNPELAERLAGKGNTIVEPTAVNPEQIETAPPIGNLEVSGEVKFTAGSAQLDLDSQTTLKNLAEQIKEFNPDNIAIVVIGHTSQVGPSDLNQSLSEARAGVVVDFLKSLGLKHQILADGKGYSLPLADFPPQDSRQQRTEIRLVRIN